MVIQNRSLVALMATSAVILSPTTAPAAEGRQKIPATKMLASLEVVEEAPRVGYDRDLFTHWVDEDRDGCDTRDEVLITEAVQAPQIGSRCTLSGGRWTSIYDGVTTTIPSEFDVDHVVALAEAWDSGASRWDAATRRAYANDLGSPFTLVAVSAPSNRSKSDADLGDWSPATTAGQCWLGRATIATKYRWSLSVDANEMRALKTLVGRCNMKKIAVTKATVKLGDGTTRPAPATSTTQTPTESSPLKGSVNPASGGCPSSHPVKGNISRERIYHVPSSPYYSRTIPEVCFADSAAAEAAGFRAPR